MSKEKVTGLVYFLHGSGGTGPDLNEGVDEIYGKPFELPDIKIIYPTAPIRKYSLLAGELSHVWFDRTGLSPKTPEHLHTIDEMCKTMRDQITREAKEHGVPLNRVVLGGFSMGGGLSLQLAYRYMPQLAGVFVMSSFLSNDSKVYEAAKDNQLSPPLLMFHGQEDPLVYFSWSKKTYEKLLQSTVKGEFVPLPETVHEINRDSLYKLKHWIIDLLPPKSE